jgi:carboxymethylenebutenolidase
VAVFLLSGKTMTNLQQQGCLELPCTGKGPGVLVLHAWWGLNPFFRDLCKRLAAEGFVAFAPDLYHGQVAHTIDEATQLRNKLKQKIAFDEIIAATEYLSSLDAVTNKAISVIGFSLGARFALELSVAKPELVRAVVTFYGNCGLDYSPAKATYLGHFAETDEWVATSGVKKLEKSLRAAGRPVTFHTYPGTGHWFFENDRSDAYNIPAAQLAWERTLEFLKNQKHWN